MELYPLTLDLFLITEFGVEVTKPLWTESLQIWFGRLKVC